MLFDRVKQTSTTTGTGDYSLDSTVPSGFRSFVAAVGSGNKCFYAVEDEDSGNYEFGVGTVTAGAPDTLARTEILGSSAGGFAVSWAAGTRNIFVSPLAARGMNIAAVRHNLDAAGENPDPLLDDSTRGYGPGSLWVYKARNKVFFCVDATAGAAEWVMVPVLRGTNTLALIQSFGTPDAALPPHSAVLSGEQYGQPFGATPADNHHNVILGGKNAQVVGAYCQVGGLEPNVSFNGMDAFGAGMTAIGGADCYAQALRIAMKATTADATPTPMTVPGASAGAWLDTGATALKVLVVAKQIGSTNCMSWEIDALMRNGNVLVGSTVTAKYNSGAPGWSVAASVAGGDFSLLCTGAAATNIAWSAVVIGAHLVEW